ncbi:MAG TPA: cupin domain-containing protein [Lentimicrobium sp.]|nr:cupin domain-containing protein [Lentimicrobium sp.]
MEILNLREAPKVPFNRDGHILCSNKNIQIVHLVLKPGEIIDKHVNENDVIFHILEGKALLYTNDSHALVSKDDCIMVEGGISRGFENVSVADFKVLLIKFMA